MSDKIELNLFRIDGGKGEQVKDLVAVEESLTLFVGGRELVSLLYTPPMAVELAVGYLLSEGIIDSKENIKSLSRKKGAIVLELEGDLPEQPSNAVRTLTSGCGGGITFTYPKGLKGIRKVASKLVLSHEAITSLAAKFRTASKLFEETGGVHSAALSDGAKFLAFADDIGRHNAVDKVFGRCLMEGIDTKDKVLLTTGRVSSEILLKSAKRKVPVIVSRGAPTTLAVSLAEKLGVTLVCFVRGRRMNVYTHIERVSL